jgi:hypothetical protein
MGAAAAAATSITGAGLGAYAQILSSQGTAAGMNYKASALESAAQRGRVGAAQTGASETEKLVTTLATRCARLPSLAAFARDLHSWLDKQPFAERSIRGGKVLSAPSIEEHIRPLWRKYRPD